MQFTIALIGRPNVGKSTLFNRLVGAKKAIVHDTPGVTRDRKLSEGKLGPMVFNLLDTPGLEDTTLGSLASRMLEQAKTAMDEADLVLFMVDGRDGITDADELHANWLRKSEKPAILVVNKCEGKSASYNIPEFYKLGLGEPIAISAEHNAGLVDLYDAIEPFYLAKEAEELEQGEEKHKQDTIRIAIIGRPNAGKSTYLNSLLGFDRSLTGPEAGITRDAIEIDWEYKQQKIKLIDTAGLRKRNLVKSDLERLTVQDSVRAINFSHVTILLLDANMPLESQDLNIANLAINEGRALVIGVNKWDSILEPELLKEEIAYKIGRNLAHVKGVPVVYMSALNHKHIFKVIEEAIKLYALWNKSFSTSKLNDWLAAATEAHPPPMGSAGRRLRFKYVTQSKTRPPTFLLFCSRPKDVTDSYLRYLTNSFRDWFSLPAVPIRFVLRKNENPYDQSQQ